MLTLKPVGERVLPIAHDTELLVTGLRCLVFGNHNDAVFEELLSLIGSFHKCHFYVFETELANGVHIWIIRENGVVKSHDFILNLTNRRIREHLGQNDVMPVFLLAAYHYNTATILTKE